MHMAQRPVVVALGVQLIQAAWRIARMRRVALERGVQHADVEPAGDRRRVVGGEIFGGFLLAEALAMQRHPQRLDAPGAGLARLEHKHVVRQLQLLRHLAFGIVIAEQQIHRNARLLEPPHLTAKENAGVVIAPGAVVQIAGQHHEIDSLVDRFGDEAGEGFAGGGAQQGERCVGVGAQAVERAV